jgi:rubrerythrin
MGGFRMNNPKEIIAFAMNMEKQGQKFYESFINQVDHPDVRKWFEILADTEKEHYEILEKQYEQLDQKGSWKSLQEFQISDQPNLFQSRRDAEKLNPSALKHSLSDLSVLRMAYLIENDSAEFYQKAMEKVDDPEGRKILKSLFEWENEHRRLFHEEYRKAMESNWFEQSFYPF